MALLAEADARWIVKDMSERSDKHNVGNWYSSERDMLGEGRERLRTMLEEAELPLELPAEHAQGGWSGRVTKLAKLEGEIIFFDRTVSGVRKPTTVVDVSLTLEWEASPDGGGQALSGTCTCPELSMEALEDGLDTPARLTDGTRAHGDAQCQAVRAAVTAAMAKLLDSVGRGFFQDLHEALRIPPPAIAPPGERPKKAAPKPKPSPPQSPTKAAAPKQPASGSPPSSPSKARAAATSRKANRRAPQKKKGGGVKTSTLIAAAVGLGFVLGTGLLLARWLGGGSSSSSSGSEGGSGGRSGFVSELTPGAARQYAVQPSAPMAGSGGGGAAVPDNPLLGLLSPRSPDMGDLRRRR